MPLHRPFSLFLTPLIAVVWILAYAPESRATAEAPTTEEREALLDLGSNDAAPTADLVGTWEGILNVNALVQLRLVLHVAKDPTGSYLATLDSIDQGALGLPIETFTFDPVAGTLEFALPAINGGWKGTRTAPDTLTGTWSQGGDMPLTFTWTTEPVALPPRPQEPHPPYPYQSIDVLFQNKVADITLAGTLTLPEGDGPFPALVLISGSGPQDRNEELFGHKPFLIIADHLTRQGIAVLRADDRGVGGSGGSSVMDVPTSDLAEDIYAAVQYLKSRPEIDATRIGLLGHSEGGLIAPMVANAHPEEVAFLILLAAPSVSGEQILYEQGALIARAAGSSEAAITSSRTMSERMYALLKTAQTDEELRVSLAAIMQEPSPDNPDQPAVTEEQIESHLKALLSRWFRYFLTYDPAPALRTLTDPVLVLYGGKDLQVPPSQSEEPMRLALQASGVPFELKTFGNLNHLFQPATTGSPQEYGTIETTIDPSVLDTMTTWIRRHLVTP